jgi:hypothetical protein
VCSETTINVLGSIARLLNDHVFQQAAAVELVLLVSASLCCERIGSLLVGWRKELERHGKVRTTSSGHHGPPRSCTHHCLILVAAF